MLAALPWAVGRWELPAGVGRHPARWAPAGGLLAVPAAEEGGAGVADRASSAAEEWSPWSLWRAALLGEDCVGRAAGTPPVHPLQGWLASVCAQTTGSWRSDVGVQYPHHLGTREAWPLISYVLWSHFTLRN